MFDGTSDVVDHQLGQLLGGAYHRFQVRLDEGMDDLDDASRTNLRALRLRAEELVTSSEARLFDLAGLLSPGEGLV
jgi:hypothetical protein